MILALSRLSLSTGSRVWDDVIGVAVVVAAFAAGLWVLGKRRKGRGG